MYVCMNLYLNGTRVYTEVARSFGTSHAPAKRYKGLLSAIHILTIICNDLYYYNYNASTAADWAIICSTH